MTWYLMFAGGRTFVGKDLDERRTELDHALEFSGAGQMGPQGLQVGYGALPILMLPSFDSIPIPQGSILKELTELSRDDQASVMRAIEAGEKLRQAMRASQSGIVVAGAVPPKSASKR